MKEKKERMVIAQEINKINTNKYQKKQTPLRQRAPLTVDTKEKRKKRKNDYKLLKERFQPRI